MTLGRELIGLPVVSGSTGRQLGVVEDLMLDLYHSKLKTLRVRAGWWLDGCRDLDYSKVIQVGSDSVITHDEPEWEDGAGDEADELISVKQLQGMRIIDTSGREKGTLEEVEFIPESGVLTGWEYSDGIIQDIIKGRERLPLGSISIYGEDRVIIQEGVGTG